ncbi:MAG TPA: tetratricopeptide repeat protein [Blastocatellia bacterium]|nr:tetratricopeptide repeat protein [Blastocatellia bacterium]
MRSRSVLLLMILVIFGLPLGASGRSDKDKEEMKAAIADLKSEVVILERQIGDLRQGLDRNSGQMGTLITQIADNVNAMRQAQSRIADSAGNAASAVGGLSEQLGGTNDRVNKLSSQVEELKKLIENMPKVPAFATITPGNPDQLFAAGIADYYRGNYDLARDEFKQFVESFPQSTMVCFAQFWVGETAFAKHNYEEAIQAYDLVGTPPTSRCEKLPAAIYKKAKAYQQLNQPDAAQAEIAKLIKYYPRSSEADLAKQDLAQH